jgi:excisionase family DNA binding protein
MRAVAEILTLREAATFLRLHPMTLYKLVRSGAVPSVKVGGQWRFARASLLGWLNDQTLARVRCDS